MGLLETVNPDRTFFTADLHLGHRAIIDMNGRPFVDVDEMNDYLIAEINSKVSSQDTLWLLGDASYRINKDEASALLSKIYCRDIRLVRGNHDKDWQQGEIFTEVCDYKELKIDKRRVCLMHYPLASWNGMYRGSVHLHGHAHNGPEYNESNVMNNRLIWDVGVDANDFAPISWHELEQKLGLGMKHE